MNEEFVRDRITSIRQKKGISEYKMSLDLGHSKGYIQGISSGRAMPSMSEFLYICDYFGITPADFFTEEETDPALLRSVVTALRALNEKDLRLILEIAERLGK